MDSIGSLIANELEIVNKIESYPLNRNVITIHPEIASYNNSNTDNIIAIVDLAQQEFQIKNEMELSSYWWLSYKSYCNQCQLIFNKYITNNDENELNILSSIIFQYISGIKTTLSSDHHIAELFIENYFETDTLITLNTPTPKQQFDFLTFSDDNPYANIDKLQITENNDEEIEEIEKTEDMNYKIEFIRADINNNNLYQWFSISFPSIISPQTTSREIPQSIYNEMLKHWECRLSEDRRFLLIFPEKLGEICDVYLNKKGKIYWIQSLYGDNIKNNDKKNKNNNNNNFNLRRIFSLNECNVTKQFECKCIKLLISTEEPARFKIMPSINNNIMIWNFSINGACNDLFAVIGNNNNYNSTNNILNNKICAIDNAQNFSNYRFKGGDLKDLIRDVPKLCSLNGKIIFGGACFLSVLNDIDKIHIYDDDDNNNNNNNNDGHLITNQVFCGFSYLSWIPVEICEAFDTSKWITDYIPFKNNTILGRWQGDIGKSVYGIWKYIENENKWKCIKSKQYDDMKWNNSIMSCYHFGDRIKTILLSIQLTNEN